MKPSELKALIIARIKGKIFRPVHVEGSPGLGKTEIQKQIAEELGIGFRLIHAPLLQPEDYSFPVVSADKTTVDFIVSKNLFPIVGADCPETGILLIDDLAQADNSTQKILRNLILEREIHGKKLKEGWTIVTTGNRTTDRAGSNRILTHLRNSLTTIELEVSLDDWTNWALNNGVKTEIISFIRFRPELLNNFNPQSEVNATPRAWVQGVSAALGVVDPSQEFEVFKGDVGEGPAAELVGFLKIYRKLPSVDSILLNPTGLAVPTDPATLYALCGSLAHRSTVDNFGRVVQFVSRIPSEFQVLFVRDATRCKKPTRDDQGKIKQCGKCEPCKIQASAEFIKLAAGPLAKVLT